MVTKITNIHEWGKLCTYKVIHTVNNTLSEIHMTTLFSSKVFLITKNRSRLENYAGLAIVLV